MTCSRARSMKKVLFILLFIVLGGVVLAVGGVGYFVYNIRQSTSQLDAIPLAPANYQPAALELVKLCQSDPTFFDRKSVEYLDPFDPVWAPPMIEKLHPEVLDVSAGLASVTWGGGFYHCGWELTKGPATANNDGHSWTLSFTTEDGPDKFLETIDVRSDLRFTEDEYIDYILAELDRRLAARWDHHVYGNADSYSAVARCLLLQKRNRFDLLPAAIHKSAANYSHDWRDVLLVYLIDHQAGEATAGDRLRSCADRTTGPCAWMFAAYAFFQGGDDAAAGDAIQKAIATKTVDPEWIDKETSAYQLGMAMRLYTSGRTAECIRMCDGINDSPHRLFDIKDRIAVGRVRDCATSYATTQPMALPEFDEFTATDPFGGFDLIKFLAFARQTSASTTQAADAGGIKGTSVFDE